MIRATIFNTPVGGSGVIAPEISGASAACATTRAPERVRRSATLPTWSGW